MACTAGCVSARGITLPGRLPSRAALPRHLPAPPLALTAGDHGQAWAVLKLDEFGNVLLNDRPLELPSAHEHRRFGVSLVDASSLPPLWRPGHARDGGVMVSRLARVSSLAVAGLRPFDVVVEVDGAAVASVDAAMELLERVPAGGEVALDVLTPQGARRITARAPRWLESHTSFSLALLVDYDARRGGVDETTLTFFGSLPLSWSASEEEGRR